MAKITKWGARFAFAFLALILGINTLTKMPLLGKLAPYQAVLASIFTGLVLVAESGLRLKTTISDITRFGWLEYTSFLCGSLLVLLGFSQIFWTITSPILLWLIQVLFIVSVILIIVQIFK